MQLRWSERADNDLAAIVEYIARDDPTAAIDVGDAIERQLKRLKDFPMMGRLGRIRGTRELVIAGLPYIVVYRVLKEEVEIARVLHGAQRWPPADQGRGAGSKQIDE